MSHKDKIKTQQDLEIIYSKYQLTTVLKDYYRSILPKLINMEALTDKLIEKVFITILVKIYNLKQANVNVMLGILSVKFESHLSDQDLSDLLTLACELDLLDYNPETEKLICRHSIPDRIHKLLRRYQFPLPSIIPPALVNDPMDTGYLTIKNPITHNYENIKGDYALDHINRANSVCLTINMEVVDSEVNRYRQPIRKELETNKDFNLRIKQKKEFYERSISVMKEINELSDSLYMTHFYDSRGRTYASGYHINTQGTDEHKAVLEFTNKELIQ